MTDKQKAFIDEYLIDYNATRAYKEIYKGVKNDNVAAVNASNLLRNPNVKEYYDEKVKAKNKRAEINQDRVLKELARLGLFDARKLFADDGQPIQITDLDDDTAACIVGIKVQENYDSNGNFVGYTKEYKLADKKGSLELLGRHLGMFRDKLEVSGITQEKNKLSNIIEQMRGDTDE